MVENGTTDNKLTNIGLLQSKMGSSGELWKSLNRFNKFAAPTELNAPFNKVMSREMVRLRMPKHASGGIARPASVMRTNAVSIWSSVLSGMRSGKRLWQKDSDPICCLSLFAPAWSLPGFISLSMHLFAWTMLRLSIAVKRDICAGIFWIQ